MKKKRVAQVLTLALIAGVIGFFAYRQRAAAPAEDHTPESAIWRMLDASREADAERYLNCYTGEMEQQLRRNFQEMGPDRFREYLSSTHRQVKGIAVFPPQMSSPTEGRLSVEYVYQDRNETQQVFVRQVGKQWKIFRVEGAERIKTLVPYGAPVTE